MCWLFLALAHLINAVNLRTVNIAQLISHWVWSGDLSRAEPGGGGAAAAAAVLAGAPEGSRPSESHQEEEACLRPQVSDISCLLDHVYRCTFCLMYFTLLLPVPHPLVSNERMSA